MPIIVEISRFEEWRKVATVGLGLFALTIPSVRFDKVNISQDKQKKKAKKGANRSYDCQVLHM
jgi:hypothetical protein